MLIYNNKVISVFDMLKDKLIRFIIVLAFASAFPQAKLFAEGLTIDIEVEHFKYAALDNLPKGPNPKIGEYQCRYYVIKNDNLKNAQAKLIDQSGWAVLAETKLANYTLVAFAGSFTDGTSGSCLINQSNIAIFNSDNLEAIVYLDDPTTALIGDLILTDAGYIRVFSGNYIQLPAAEIHLTESGLALTDTSAFTPYCKGGSIVPDVIGKNIAEAREVLFQYGFRPSLADEPDVPAWRSNLLEEGIIEIDACSNTGFAYCRFNYNNNVSEVSLVTAGEDRIPTVIRDDVDCY